MNAELRKHIRAVDTLLISLGLTADDVTTIRANSRRLNGVYERRRFRYSDRRQEAKDIRDERNLFASLDRLILRHNLRYAVSADPGDYTVLVETGLNNPPSVPVF